MRLQCAVHDLGKLRRPIILGLSVNVHSHFAVLMTGQVLDRLRIYAGMDQVGDIGVTQLMRRDLEVQAVNDVLAVHASLARFRLKLLLDRLPIHVLVQRPFLRTTDPDIVPDPVELRV